MDKLREVKSKLVLTNHGKDNLFGRRKDCDRTDISVNQVASAIAFAKFKNFAGHRRYKVTYKGVTVLYKVDTEGCYVVITYYKNKYKNKRRKVLTY